MDTQIRNIILEEKMRKVLSAAKRTCVSLFGGLAHLREDLSIRKPALLRLIPDETPEEVSEYEGEDPYVKQILSK